MKDAFWQYTLGESDWTSTPIEDIRVDLHTKLGTVSLSLPMLIDLIYPLIERRLDKALSVEIRATSALDGKKIAKIVTTESPS